MRAASSDIVRAGPGARAKRREEGLPLRLHDVVITLMASLAFAHLLFGARDLPGAGSAIFWFGLIAAGAPLLRFLAQRFPRIRGFDLVASFWPLWAIGIAHANMGPVIDSLNLRLLDASLAHADLKLFGVHPAVWLGERVSPLITEFAMVSYYTYFLWPTLLGLLLYRKGRHREFDHFLLAMTLVFCANFVFYVLVPAIGPRYFLADEFRTPLQGIFLAPLLEGLMRMPQFVRDCFPSGHTAGTLCVLLFAYWYHRRFFAVMLPWGLGLILGTLVGRFHYGIDLLCAVPLLAVCVATANALARARPAGVVVQNPAIAWRGLQA